MKILPFKSSPDLTLGIELELQIIDPHTYGTKAQAKNLIRSLYPSDYQERIKPEITQSMIELNSSIHHSPKDIAEELLNIQSFLLEKAHNLDISICGGGTHPFQKWSMQKIFPTMRYKNLSRQYRYLSKRSTVFGQHIHIGCKTGEDALYLTHALARYVPQLIALSASSPFYQGVDTGYDSSRSNVFNAFPLSGVIPYLTDWQEFSAYFYKMRNYGIIKTMKDFYWDIRPKPEFGTVEIRVCDTPLTIDKAVMITAYVQSISRYILEERPFTLSKELYYIYNYNRFQASRYGFEGIIIDHDTHFSIKISDDILNTMKIIEKHTNYLNNTFFVLPLMQEVIDKKNDAEILRQIHKQVGSLPKVVSEQCKIWSSNKMD